MQEKYVKIKNTKNDLSLKLIIGGLFLIFGLAALSQSQYAAGIAFILVGILAFTFGSGVEIDSSSNKVRSYIKYLWITKGNWISIDDTKRICIKRVRKGMQQYGGRTNASISRFHTYYDVFLLSNNYKKGFLIFSSKEKESSFSFAEKWSKELNIPFVNTGIPPQNDEKTN